MVIKTTVCAFSDNKIYPGHGLRYCEVNGRTHMFISRKVHRFFKSARKPLKFRWSIKWRIAHKKVRTEENKKKVVDAIPETFATEQEAGEFWDTHSLADYEEFLEPAEMEFRIEKRTYEVQVSEDVFESLRKKAASSHQPMRKVIDQILRKELSAA